MRLLSTLLAILVLFLSVQPVCGALKTAPDACCEAACSEAAAPDEADGGGHEEDDCTVCNPFQACGCCAASVSVPATVMLKQAGPVPHQSAKWIAPSTPLFEVLLSGFWQPPRSA